MLKKTITYADWNGASRTEDFYFNLSKPEILRLQVGEKGGLDATLVSISQGGDPKTIMEFFEKFIYTAYGEKSEDGRRFMKSDEISRAFMETPAYEKLFEELVTNADAAGKFVNAVMGAENNTTPELHAVPNNINN